MLLYVLLVFFLLFSLWLLWSYLQERKFRKKPYYALAEIGWRTVTPPPFSERIHSVALVGDLGNAGPVSQDPVMKSIQGWLEEAGEQSTIIFLGDNVYPVGIPPQEHRLHQASVQKLQYQLDLLKAYRSKVIYLGGNHDWNKGRKNGYDYLMRQQQLVQEHLQDPHAYLPKDGCLGPVSWEINEGLLLIIINTQWWVQRGFRPIGEKYGCSLKLPTDFYSRLDSLLTQNKHRFVVIAAHHPLYSNALHGGKFTVKQQVFPLTFVNKRALIPLPLMGTIFRYYRKYLGANEDMSYPPYRRLRKRLLKMLHQHQNLFYVAGHDHNLQYFQVQGNHYAVSGSGSKTNFVAKGGKASFSHENKGFMVLDQYRDGTIWLRVLEPSLTPGAPSVLAFQKCVYAPTTPPAPRG
nr:metallophosphoesterase [Rufibacter quisquiliarum]